MLKILSTTPKLNGAPKLHEPVPGPLAQALITRDERVTSPSYTRPYPLAVKRAHGAVVEDLDGNSFLDFTAGIAVCNTGHCHPRVVAAIKRQADTLLHMCGADFYYEPLAALAEKLAALAPGKSPKRVYFGNSGTEAIEAAIKLARQHTGRQYLIAFRGAFHGRTLGAVSLTASKAVQRRGFGPLLPGVIHVGYPNPYRCEGSSPAACGRQAVEFIEREVLGKLVAPDEVAAIFVEPIQGEGGYIVPPDDFHPRLKELTQKHGMLYVADEIQSGMGRTGKMFALEHWGVEADVICLAKGLASGLPLSAVIAREELMDWAPGAHASTFGGNPLGCVAAIETVSLLEEGLMDNAAEMGAFLLDRLADWPLKHALVGDVRGKGLMIGVDLVRDKQHKTLATKERDAIVQSCFRRGLLLLGCGQSAIRLCPPLVISREEAEKALGILESALEEVEAGAVQT
jgi:4-aminobutyrate aminotransferase